LKNIISVTAIDPGTEVLSSSNYGVLTVDIAAPGQNILSCLPHNSYGLMTGTSQATAFVSGAASLVMSHKNQYFQAEEIKKYILATGDTASSLVAKTRTSRQLNLFKSLTILGSETGFSGTAVRDNVKNKFLSVGSQDKAGFGGEQASDPNLDNMKNVASFGQLLRDSVAPRKKARTRTAEQLNQPAAVKTDGN
ncbi:MAG: S8 family serine peptidase, partial [Bdellovibrionaceae bacterium]|nr:S8 family serine peptidase [Pseudobdellovibrionaceae bacterium]